MADKLPLVELVASIRGFYNGAMVEPGAKFMFDPNSRMAGGNARPYPKWAAPAGKAAEKKPPPPPTAFDTRPKASQAAAKAKFGQVIPE